MPRTLCPSCHRSTSSAGGLCDPCRLGVPIGTEGLQVQYPPEPAPSPRERILRLLRGPVAFGLYTLLLSAALFLIAHYEPSFRPWFVRLMTGATALSFIILLIHIFTSLDLLDAIAYLRSYHWWFHEESTVDPRPTVVFCIFGAALLIGRAEFGIP